MHVFREGCPAALTTHWTHTLPRACSQSLPSVQGIVHSEMNSPLSCSKPKCCYIFLRNEKTVKNSLSALTIIFFIMTVHSDRGLTRYKKEKHYKSGPDGTTFKLFMWGKDTNLNYYSQIIFFIKTQKFIFVVLCVKNETPRFGICIKLICQKWFYIEIILNISALMF